MKKAKVVGFRVNGSGELIAILSDGISMNAKNSKHLKLGDEVSYTPVTAGDKYVDSNGAEHTYERNYNKFESFVPEAQLLASKIANKRLELLEADAL